ncbi:hypothetical protein HZ993_07330 [Rhodoferax sp. AJA081-3]|uniref:hypothetical protein n=1 Tax=Rhodoferax sp. AJA081-3 TaxID=2752316 RepID=UPI001ADF00BF|nr:hypothetical protein [Rhodoferax sp. AJA081-3]QTN29618.1 hypothetical protein HZ993_07330 [Rhodoferax sp. AJA081-3]
MASVDLFFERTPAAGPPWTLLFGDLLGEAPARTLEFAGQFAELSFAGRASSIIPCNLVIVFPEMTFASSALYQSKTQRPTVAKVGVPWSKSATAKEFGATGQHTVANRQPLGTQDNWTSADRSLLGVSAAQYSALGHDTRTLAAFEVALHKGPEPSCLPFQGGDPAVRLRIKSAFQVAARLGASRVRDFFNAGVKTPSVLQGRWNAAAGYRFGALSGAGRALRGNRGWQLGHQDGWRPRAGRWVATVPTTPPVRDPCYLPDTHLLFDATWAMDTGLIFICERNATPLPTGETVVVPIRRIYMVVNNASLHRVDGNILLPTFSMTVGLDVDSWTWSFSAALPGRALADLEPAGNGSPVEVEAVINGTTFRSLVESIERTREFGSNNLRVSGRGKTALLDAPYAPTLSFTNSQGRTAQQLMGDVLTFNGVPLGWEVQWGLVDWSIPAGVFNHQGSYIGALNKIAASAGGYVQPHASSQIVKVLPRYPTVPWEWDTVTPDFQLPADVTSRESFRWIEKPAYNRVFVSGQEVGVLGQVTRTGTAGEILAPMVVDALVTNATAARQRGIALLADTGRQIEVSLRLPVLAETGIIVPGAFVDYQDGSVSRRGLVRSTQVEAGLPEVWQTLGVQTYA